MTITQRIIAFLQAHPEGVDDDELTRILGLKARQQANARCRKLEKEGLVIRRTINGKIHNFLSGKDAIPIPHLTSLTQEPQNMPPKFGYWFWEGNVQSKVKSYLIAQGYGIRFEADTASHQRGIDIVAEKEGKLLWVTVKGYPKGTEKTNPRVQASHWFKQAIFDIVEYRERDKAVLLAVALPDFPRYHSLAQKITWLKSAAIFSYFWINEFGDVSVE